MADTAGTVRFNPETGVANVLTGSGWQAFTGDEAKAYVQAAEQGMTGALMAGVVDAVTLGLAESPTIEATKELYPIATKAPTAAAMLLPGGGVGRGGAAGCNASGYDCAGS